MSLKSAIVMYRVDGVSGLNDLTGIKSKVPEELANHHSRPRCGDQLSARKSAGPKRLLGARDAETIKRKSGCKRFVEKS